MEVNKGLLAFFGEEDGAVGGGVHEEVLGADAMAGEVGLGCIVEGVGTGGAGSGVDAPDAGGEPAGAVPGGCTVELC